MAKGFTKKVFLQKQGRRKTQRTIQTLCKIITGVIIISCSCGCVLNKTHKVRECTVTNVNDSTLVITVQHPNGWTYDYQADCTENISEGETIKVIFNELTDWEKNYSVVNIIK